MPNDKVPIQAPRFSHSGRIIDKKNLQISYTNCINSLETIARATWPKQTAEKEFIGVVDILFKHLGQIGFAPSIYVYNALLRTLAQVNMVDDMNKVMWHMVCSETKAIGWPLFQEENQVLPDIETFNILIALHVEQENSPAVNKIFENLIKSGITPNERTFQLIASLCFSVKDVGMLMKASTHYFRPQNMTNSSLGKDMVNQTGIPVSVDILNLLIRVIAQEERGLNVTEKIVTAMEKKGVQPNLDTFSAILEVMETNNAGAVTKVQFSETNVG